MLRGCEENLEAWARSAVAVLLELGVPARKLDFAPWGAFDFSEYADSADVWPSNTKEIQAEARNNERQIAATARGFFMGAFVFTEIAPEGRAELEDSCP